MPGFVKLGISIILVSMFAWGIMDQIFNRHSNECEMTYMYEYPAYVPIALPQYLQKKFPYYKLYVYGEGRYAEQLSKGQFGGVPVLFIPGNGGSYKQVRSLGSVAYRKSMDDDTPRVHFNFFTVDLNEDLAAFYGPALHSQAMFVSNVVPFILSLYSASLRKPQSIVLVGHSMGGLVARAVPIMTKADPFITPLIITQATPHSRPIVVPDSQISRFYNIVNQRWEMKRKKQLKNIVLISIGAGRSDIQVPSSHIDSPLSDITTTTAEVPGCWLTTDHQAIVWCKQLVMATVRALFESIDLATFQLSENREKIVKTFNYHLVNKSDGKLLKYAQHPDKLEDLDTTTKWTTFNSKQFEYHHPPASKHMYLITGLRSKTGSASQARVVVRDLDKADWIFACRPSNNSTKKCESGLNLSKNTYIAPGKRKVIDLDLKAINKMYNTLGIWLPYTDSDDKYDDQKPENVSQEMQKKRKGEVDVYVDIFNPESRLIQYEALTIGTFAYSDTVVEATPQNALSFNLNVTGFFDAWQSYHLFVSPINCSADLPTVVSATSSWNKRKNNLLKGFLRNSFIAEVDLPPQDKTLNHSMYLEMLLDPKCTYSISMQVNIRGVFHRLSQLYALQLPCYCIAQILALLAYQYKHIGTEGKCDYLISALGHISPIAVIPFVKATSLLLRYIEVDDDFSIMDNAGINMGLLPVLLFMVATPITWAICLGIWVLVVAWGNAAHVFIIRILKRSLGTGDVMAELVVTGLSKIPIVLVVGLVSLAYQTSGAFSLCIATGFYFIKIFKIYEDYLENLVLNLIPGVKERSNSSSELTSAQLHLILLVLLGFVTALCLPSFIIWGKLVKERVQLVEDPTFIPAVLCLIAMCFLWQKEIPKVHKRFYSVVGFILNGLAVLVVLIGSVNLYRVPYIVSMALLIVALHQVLAPTIPHPNENERKTEKPGHMSVVNEDSASTNNTGEGITEITNHDPVEDFPFGSDTEASGSLSQSSEED